MDLPIQVGVWDVALVAVVAAQCTAIAYVHAPRWKAILFSLPLPFTFAVVALGRPVGVTHAAAIALLIGFTHLVRLLHYGARVPIVATIIVSAVAYCVAATLLARVLPDTPAGFWSALAMSFCVCVVAYRLTARRDEPGHRTPLPVWFKVPIVAAVICGVVLIKVWLSGFMTLFPMVGVVTAYEARHSLWTICRQAPACMMAVVPMSAVVYLMQGSVGIGWALLAGWGAFACVFVPLTWAMWFARPTVVCGVEEAAG